MTSTNRSGSDNSTNTPRMLAMTPRTWGGPEVLTPVELDRPEPGPLEVLVRIHAAGVNPTDWKSRASGGFGNWGDPPILGFDISGVVEAVGFGVTLFKPGDAVFGMPRFPQQAGAYAEYLTSPQRHLVHKPAGIDHVQAAALPVAALTAWQSLVDAAQVQPGQRVLIHAAAGGVGHLAVQIAKHLGALVIGTAREGKHDFLRGLGADELVDYTRVDFAEAVGDVDVVIDLVGGEYGPRSLRTLRKGGLLVSLTRPGEGDPAAEARRLGVRWELLLVEPDQAGLKAIAGLVEEGRLRVEIAGVFGLRDAAKAHELGERGRTTGKIVLTMTE